MLVFIKRLAAEFYLFSALKQFILITNTFYSRIYYNYLRWMHDGNQECQKFLD